MVHGLATSTTVAWRVVLRTHTHMYTDTHTPPPATQTQVPTARNTHKCICKHTQQAVTVTHTRNLTIRVDTEGSEAVRSSELWRRQGCQGPNQCDRQ